MDKKVSRLLKVLLLLQITIFILIVAFFVSQIEHRAGFIYAAGSGILFFILGIILLIVTFKNKLKGKLKVFLLLAGFAPPIGIISVVLHNVFYGLFIYFFGENFWESTNMIDEPFFFILALLICPVVFLIGAIGSYVLLLKQRK